MEKNDEIIINIEDIGIHGEGIGHFKGMAFFVPRALPGDTIKAGITKITSSIGYARIIEIIEPSRDRIEPECPIAEKCGGCQLQHLKYSSELKWKAGKVRQDLIRLGGFSPEEIDAVMEEPIGMDFPYRYRNKAQFPVGYEAIKEENRDDSASRSVSYSNNRKIENKGNRKIVTGFYAGRSHRIVPTEDCMLLAPQNKGVTEIIRKYMEEFHIVPYDGNTGKGLIRHILTRYGRNSGELMICLIATKDRLPQEEYLCQRLTMAYPEISSITINVNKRRDNVILGESNRTIWGSDSIMDTIGGIQFKISPQSFYQVNPIQTEKLYNRALSYAGLTGKETVWDLYCGIGTISLFMARHAKMVYGVEVVDRAVKDAAENARINGIKNARFITGKAEEILPEFYGEGGEKLLESFSGDDVDGSDRKNIKTDIYSSNENTAAEAIDNNEKSVAEEARTPDVIVVDPPRKGLDAACIDTMIAMSPEKIVYVSCNPSTLARDLRMLADGGYKLMKYTPVDQFSRTVHVETVVLMSRVEGK